jgi:diacyltrehalose acyltransferase
MLNVRERSVSAIAALALALGTSTLVAPAGRAEEAVLIPGATVFKQINPLYPVVATTYPDIGIHFHADPNPQVVEYCKTPSTPTGPSRTACGRRSRRSSRPTARSW